MIRQPLLLALLGGLLCASPWLEAAGPGQMPALVLEQFVDGQWQTPTRVVAWGESPYNETLAKPPADLRGVVAIAAGSYHTVALKSNGTVTAWGNNGYGQASVPADLGGVVAIAAGRVHTVALKNDGSIVAWGDRFSGLTKVPEDIGQVIAIAAGSEHNVALKSDGTLVQWSLGQQYLLDDSKDVIAIAAGAYHTLALKRDGSVIAWGHDFSGVTHVPANLSGVVSIASGSGHVVALKNDGSVVAWGDNESGQTNVPADLSEVVAIAAFGIHSLAYKNDGSVVVWGEASDREQGEPTNLSDIEATAQGLYQTVALTSSAIIAKSTIGSSSATTLRLTNPSSTHTLTGLRLALPASTAGQFSSATPLPSTLAPGESAEITIRYSQGTLEDTAGWLLVFGDGETGPLVKTQLRVVQPKVTLLDLAGRSVDTARGNGLIAWGFDPGVTDFPDGLMDVVAIAAGKYTSEEARDSAALTSDGRVVEWGYEDHRIQPVGLTSVVAIALGGHHSVALKTDGSVVSWGDQYANKIRVPTNLRDVVAISAGVFHTLALKGDGKIVAWGDNTQGQTKVPAGLKGVTAIAAGGAHSLALKSDGKIIAWGDNSYGQTRVPAQIREAVAIAAGGAHSAALTIDGEVHVWGAHSDRIGPCIVAIAAGDHHTLTLGHDGQVSLNEYSIGPYPHYISPTMPAGLNGIAAIAAGAEHDLALVEAANQFPSVQLSEERDHTIILKNTGGLTLNHVSAVIEGPDANQFSLPSVVPQTFALGSQSPFTLRFSPTRIGSIDATLKIHSNAPDSPFVLPIKGKGSYETTAQKYGEPNDLTYWPLQIERQTGLVLQRIEFDNHTHYPMHGLRLVLSKVASGVTIFSSSAGKVHGTLEVLYTKAIAPKKNITFDLVYHDPNRRATASIQPVIKAQALEAAVPTPGPVTGTNVPLLRVQKLPQGPALEWNSKAGLTYVVEYSDDAGKTWSSAVHRLTSRGTRLFWIDRGQPETFSAPIVGTRSYRVKRL